MTNQQLISTFRSYYADSPEPRISRAPGRVNLIGEHVDYNGIPVLPMTLNREIRIAFAPRSDRKVLLRNIDSRFSPTEFDNDMAIAPSPPGSWEDYIKAAIVDLNGRLGLNGETGMNLLVDGTLPSAGGLSSSSALVVATALAYLSLTDVFDDTPASRLQLADWLAEAERYVGTQGGGMDQAIILLGDDNSASKIDFSPLRVERVPIFTSHQFVLCDSRVRAEKSGNRQHAYNAGPILCRLIRALVEKTAQRTFGDEITIDRLVDLWAGPLCLLNNEVKDLFAEAFPQPLMTLDEASRALGLTPECIRTQWLGELPEPPGGFPLQAMARHQLTEYMRVEAGRDALAAGDAETFGALMNASHESCAQDYAVSCPELDRLVAIGRDAGSIGSRMTGAGFGGYTVHLVPTGSLERFKREVVRAYYDGDDPDTPKGRNWILPALPGRAASID